MESTLVELLILKRLGEGDFYKVVIVAGLEIVWEFEGPRGGGACVAGHEQTQCPNHLDQYNILLLFVKYKL
jgi:hypothetical protein